MKNVTVKKIHTYDIVANPGFYNATLPNEQEIERIRKEKLRHERKEKLEKLKISQL